MSLQSQPFYEFGPFLLEPSERLLLRSGESVPLPPKAFDTLLLLVQNSGHVLSKDELMKTLWPDTFVEENNLTQHVSMLRRALGEGAGDSGYIETVPRLGYRFVVPVREVAGNGDAELLLRRHTRTHIVLHEQEEEEVTGPDIAGEPAVRTNRGWWPQKTSTRKWIIVGAFTGVIAVAAVAFIMLRSGRISFQPKQPRTLAVLPFRDLKPDAESQFLSYSLADAIINRLGYIREITVRPSSYVAKYRNGDADPGVVARELHAQAVLTGNYIREGDRLRVTAELVDVAQAKVLWHDTLDVPYDQLMTVQDRVAESVLRGLKLQILPQEEQRLKQSVPKNPIAYEYFLRAQASPDFHLAIQLLDKSLALDPDYAPAWVRLGLDYGGYAAWQGGGPEYRSKSKAAFDKALQLDPDVPHVRTYSAIQMMERGELDQGVLNLREELRLNPNDAQAHWWLTEAYLYGGMLPESIAEGERALQLDPLVNTGSTLNSYLYSGDYEKFLSTMAVGEDARTTFYRGLCFLYMKDLPRAAGEFEHAYALDSSLLHAKYGKAFLYAIQQQPAEGLQYLREVEQKTPTVDGEMLYKVAQAYALLGDKPSALRSLQGAINHNFYCHACLIRDPLLESVRGEVEYADIVKVALDLHEAFRRRYF
jgi:DNA-binding winged helix-turn-helix (wHTH) protein/TolB-like protein/tetratricopeptide (TPR) repeat protein